MKTAFLLACAGLLPAAAFARSVPQNVRDFYNRVSAQANCTRTLKGGFADETPGKSDWSYCEEEDVLFLHHDGGGLANMDIDADGYRPNGKNPPDSQDGTAFESTIKSYHAGIKDLDPYIHPYVVFGNQGTKKGYTTFHPVQYGVEPLSVMAVVCGDQLIYGIWGDTNGDDDFPPSDVVGEASVAMGRACYGPKINANNGHTAADVLYVAFKGKNAVPGAKGANWAAKNYQDFECSIEELGDKLIESLH